MRPLPGESLRQLWEEGGGRTRRRNGGSLETGQHVRQTVVRGIGVSALAYPGAADTSHTEYETTRDQRQSLIKASTAETIFSASGIARNAVF